MKKEIIAEAETIALAQKKACELLGVEDESPVHFEVIQIPRKKKIGIFGGKTAKVRATYTLSPAKISHEYLQNILKKMNFGEFELTHKQDGNAVSFQIDGKNAGAVIGWRGRTLAALQYLVGLCANAVSDEYLQVTVNVGDFRDRRTKNLQDLGKKLAFTVLRTGHSIELEPMSPFDRRIVHLSVLEVQGVVSWSIGEGVERHIMVAKAEPQLPRKAN